MFKSMYTKLSISEPSSSKEPSFYTDRSSSEDNNPSSHQLLNEQKESLESEFHPRQHEQRRQRSYLRAILAHGLIFATYSLGLLAASIWYSQRVVPVTLTFSPAQEAIELQKVYYDGRLEKHSHFKGDPHPGGDEAWHDLVKNINLRISADELQKMNKTALALHDGSGFHGQLNVYHHLHCLKFIREFIYDDYYKTPKSSMTKIHIDHCIEDIRVDLMCHADTSVSVFNWQNDMRHPMPSFVGYDTCTNWQKLDDWATQRSFSMFDQKSLVHPKYGLSFPRINGSIERTPVGPDMSIVWPKDD